MVTLKNRLSRVLGQDFFKLMGGSAYVFAFRITGAASVYLTQVVLARWLGPEALGAYVYAFSWLIMLAVMSGFGFPAASYRYIGQYLTHEDTPSLRGYIRRSTQVVALGSVSLAIVTACVVAFVPDLVRPEYKSPLLIAIATAPIMAMMILRTALAQAFSWFDLSVIPNDALRPLVFLLALAALWWFSADIGIQGVMAVQFFVMLLMTSYVFIQLSRRLRQHVELTEKSFHTRQWFRTASPLLVIILFSGYFSEVNMIIVGSYLGAEDLAVFNAAFRTAFMIGFGITAVDAVTVPKASRLLAGGETMALQALIRQATLLKFCGALVAVGLFIVFGESILKIFGPGFEDGYRPLVTLGVAMLVIASTGSATELLSISGHQDHCLYVFFVAFLATMGLHSILIPALGLEGASISVLLVVIGYTTWLNILVVRKLGIHPSILGFFFAARGDRLQTVDA